MGINPHFETFIRNCEDIRAHVDRDASLRKHIIQAANSPEKSGSDGQFCPIPGTILGVKSRSGDSALEEMCLTADLWAPDLPFPRFVLSLGNREGRGFFLVESFGAVRSFRHMKDRIAEKWWHIQEQIGERRGYAVRYAAAGLTHRTQRTVIYDIETAHIALPDGSRQLTNFPDCPEPLEYMKEIHDRLLAMQLPLIGN